ncbi:hypothetical protein ZWY2020_030546 [Hordeum vulgare]|nr:hypothetical protein ZWY2020_030546 [Hordeum vulgare]
MGAVASQGCEREQRPRPSLPRGAAPWAVAPLRTTPHREEPQTEVPRSRVPLRRSDAGRLSAWAHGATCWSKNGSEAEEPFRCPVLSRHWKRLNCP